MIKKMTLVLSIAFTLLTIQSSFGQSDAYYYYQSEKVFLDIDRRYISLNLKSNDLGFLSNYTDYFDSRTELKTVIDRQHLIATDSVAESRANIVDFYLELTLSDLVRNNHNTYNTFLNSLNTEPSVIKASSCYKNMYDRVGMTNRLYVNLKNQSDQQLLYSFAELHDLEVLGKDTFIDSWYTLTCNTENPFNALEFANIFQESGLFASAEPEFLLYDLQSSNDTYYNDQWGMNNTGQHGDEYTGIDINIEDAWEISTGEGVNVAVYDSGFEINHPDLIDNVLGLGFNVMNGVESSYTYGKHGTACAGIIGAVADNEIGIAGVAPNTNLISISVYFSYATNQMIGSGFEWAYNNNVDIISNSWGGFAPSDYLKNRIDKLLNEGRNGKGIIIVFATGNDDSFVQYPAKYNDKILAVGAIDITTNRAGFSNYSEELDIMAPGDRIPTTDRQGETGYNSETFIDDYENSDYTGFFDGTSAACPHVAGVAALILSINPDLTNVQVNNIIELTAQKIGEYDYAETTSRPNGGWNIEMGYGLLDAHAATVAATNIPQASSGSDVTLCNTGEEYTLSPLLIGEDVSFYWEHPDGTTSALNQNIEIIQTPSSSGTYVLHYYNEIFPSILTDEVNVSILSENTDLEITQIGVCDNESISLESELEGEFSYTWESDWIDFVDPGNQNSYEFTTTEPFQITLSAYSTMCDIELSNTYTVNLFEEIDYTYIDDVLICLGEEEIIGLEAEEGYGYRWLFYPYPDTSPYYAYPISFNSYLSTEGLSGQYKLQRVSQCGEYTPDLIEITRVEEIPLNLIEPEPICPGETVNIPVEYDNAYTYVWTSDSETFVVPDETQASLTFIPLESQTCTLTLTNSQCPEGASQEAVFIEVIEESSLTLTNPEPICPGETVSISVEYDDAYTYVWTSDFETFEVPEGTQASLTFSPLESQTCTLTVTSIQCPDIVTQATVNIEVNEFEYTSSLGESMTVCSGFDLVLGDEMLDGYLFEWSSTDPNFTPIEGNISQIPLSPIVDQTITLEVTSLECENQTIENSVAIDVIELTPDFTSDLYCNEPPIELSISPDLDFLNYQWVESFGDNPGTIVSEESGYTLIDAETGSYSYDISVTGAYCDELIETQISTVEPYLEIDLPTEVNLCIGDEETFAIEDFYGAQYEWKINDEVVSDTYEYSFVAEESFTLELSASVVTCDYVNTHTINVYVSSTPEAQIVESHTLCEGEEIELIPSGIDNWESYYFTYPNGVVAEENTNITATYNSLGTYLLTVTTNGCGLSTEYQIEVSSVQLASSVSLPTINACYGEEISSASFDSNFEYQLIDEQGQAYPNNTLNAYQNQILEVEVNESICNSTYSTSVEVQVDDCCVVPGDAYDFSEMTSSNLGSNTFENQIIYVNNMFIVDNTISFEDCEFYMGPNASIALEFGELALTGCTLRACADEMWYGIIADNFTESINITNSLVKDAQTAIDASKDASVKLKNSDFENNHISASFNEYVSGQLISIISNDFYTNYLLPPYNGQDSYGIQCNTVENITIGSPENDELYRNKFINLMQGVQCENTSSTIVNNDFENLYSGVKNKIIVVENPDDFLFKSLWVDNCTFTNLDYGVQTSNLVNWSGAITIEKNIFNDIEQDAINCTNTGNSTLISYNRIHSAKYAIRAQNYWGNADTYSVKIEYNKIYNPGTTGILVTSLGQSQISNEFPLICYNAISFNEPLAQGQTAQGIRVEGCNKIIINDNEISREWNELSLYEIENLKGLVLNQTYNAKVTDNYIAHMGRGIYGVGVLNFSKFVCNQLVENYHGFHFEDNFATNITDQGSLTNPTDNTWIDSELLNSERVVSGVFSDGIPNWYHRGLDDYNPLYTSDEIEFIQTANELPFVCSFDQDNNLLVNQTWLSYVAQDDYSYTDYNEEYKFRDKKDVFKTLKNEPELYLNDIILENFFNLLEESNLAKIVNVHEKMSSGDISEAIIENESIISDKLYVQNRKEVNSIYLNSIAQGLPLSEADSASLEQIAYLTPYLGGDAVFSARVMLGLDVMDEGIEYRHAQESSSKSDIVIYPNPSSDIVNIHFDGYEHIEATIQIYDLSGRLLLNNTVKALESILDISYLSEGVYLLKIAEGDKVLLSEQLIKLKK